MTVTINVLLLIGIIAVWTWLVAYVARLHGKWDCAMDILSCVGDAIKKTNEAKKGGEMNYDDCK